jgi:transcriptional regulator with XRE-family HTH domain
VTLDEVVSVLTEERKKRGWSYRDVSEACPPPGLSNTAIRAYEKRDHEPKVLNLSTWAAALGYELELDLKSKQREEATG